MNEEEIFHQALARTSPEERAAYLDQACAGNPVLRASVEALLRANVGATGFLDQPAPAPVATAEGQAVNERPGTMIGPYKLIEPIGEGGMGSVWMAQQTEPVKRLVALKLIKAGMDSKQVIARFEAERQALALMDHPHIAKVLDGGTSSAGRPYFVMELVKGVPITRYCDEHHLTPRERLELFVPVCQAVQHAHLKGIIHRDLKPSNVLIAPYDGKPVVKVIDFGVAKAAGQPLTDKTLVTGFGAIVGTLEYMSPEQAEINQLDIDTRSDIYSLGVLLYELLTGSPPFSRKELERAGMLEMLRVIREEEPSKPSTKLSTAEGLPTLAANRGTEPMKLTRLVRGELDWIVMKALEKDRNRRYETANGFAADVERYLHDEPVLASPPSVGYRLRKFVRRNRKGLAAAVAIPALVVVLASVIGWAVRDRAARAQEAEVEAARQLALTDQGIREALERAEALRQELDTALRRPGGVQEMLNQPNRWIYAINSARAELDQARRLARRSDQAIDPERLESLGRLEQQLARDDADRVLAFRLEDVRLARAATQEREFDRVMEDEKYPGILAEAGFPDVRTDPAAAAAQFRASPIRELFIEVLDDWARLAYRLRGDERLTEQLLAAARATSSDPAWGDRFRQLDVWRDKEKLRRLVDEAPVARLSPRLAILVGALHPTGSPAKQSWLRRAQAEHPTDFWLNFVLGGELEQSSPADAVGFYRAALVVRPTCSVVYNNLGNVLESQKETSSALAAYGKAIELDPNGSLPYYNLGNLHLAHQHLPEAIAAFTKAVEVNPDFARAHNNLGLAYERSQQIPKAVTAYRKAIAIDPNLPDPHFNLGKHWFTQKQYPDAVIELRKAIELNPGLAQGHHLLGMALFCQLKYTEAEAAERQALAHSPDFADAHYGLGLALHRQGKFAEALESFRRGHELGMKVPGWKLPAGQYAKECERYLEIERRLPDALKGNKPLSAKENSEFGDVCHLKGWHGAATRFYEKAFARSPATPHDGRIRSAVLAGCGQSRDPIALDEKAKADCRRLALHWLQAEVRYWKRRLVIPDARFRAEATEGLKFWLSDPDLAPLRDPERLKALPMEERADWELFWRDLNAVLMDTKPPG